VGLLSAVVSFSLRNKAVVLLGAALLFLFGTRAALTLPIDAVPDVTDVQVQVITTSPALAPTEVEQYVSIPVERAMAGIPKTREVRSISKYGISVVTIVFEDGTDMYWARQLVAEHMIEARSNVPPHYGVPEMGPITTGLGEVCQFVIENPALDGMKLEEILDWQIRPALRTVPGIVEVDSFGGARREYQVVLDPARLQAAGVSVSQVVDALDRSNANAGGGYVEHNRERYVIGSRGLVKDIDDLRRVVIGATPEGVPITVATVGDAAFGPRLRYGAASMNGKGEVVVGVALMLMGENARTVTERVKAKLTAIEPSLPKGTKLSVFYDRSVLVNRTIRTVLTNLGEGALLVVAVLFLLLGDLRAGAVVATIIPLALLFAVTAMNAMGLSGNLMSLGAIDFGLIVDGAVIIVENAVRRLGEAERALGRPLDAAARSATVEAATLEVRAASVIGEGLIAVVYLPVLALTDIEGKLFRPMATTVLLALAGAMLLSLTLVPVLTALFVRAPKGEHEAWVVRATRRVHAPTLAFAMRHRGVTAALAGGLLGAAVLAFLGLGGEFTPTLDEGDLLVESRRLPDVALTASIDTDKRVQQALLEIPEIRTVVSKTGSPQLATDPMGIEQTDVYLALKDRSEWRRGLTKEALAGEIAGKITERVPEVGGFVSQPIQMRTNELVAGIRSDGAMLVYGPDLDVLSRLADRAATAIRRVPGAEDVRIEQVSGLKYLRVIPDRNRLARYGLTVADVNQIVETISVGHSAGEVMEGERRFGMVVKVRHEFAGDLDPLMRLPLRSVTGQIVPLGDVADIEVATGPAEINRRNQSRRITVEFNARGRDLKSVVGDAARAVQTAVPLEPGYRVEWGGQLEHYEGARRRLEVVVPVALALIAFLSWLAFRSIRVALVILLGVPFAFIGGVFALYARQIPFSISAGVGFIALFGVAVLNGLVMVSFSRDLEATGIPTEDAIFRVAELRLRPVLMTALVASLGFLPMALSTAPGSEVQRPLATVVIGGLVTATLLTLYLLPAAYAALTGSGTSAHD
jgi:cobalt-zinc-cadmium resistance protein CzcA